MSDTSVIRRPWLLTGSAGRGPPGVTLDLKFAPPTLDPRITFTRASTATYFDSSGTMQTAATNAPRFDYDPVTHALRGLLIEEARTNALLNTATLGTQSVAVTAQAYTLSFYGTGTVTLTGTSTAGPLTGTGAGNRVSLTFTPTAGTLTCTVTGSVLNAQLEAGAFATSWVATTAAAVTRAVDVCSMPTSGWYSTGAGSLLINAYAPPVGANAAINVSFAAFSDGTSNMMDVRQQLGTVDFRFASWAGGVGNGNAMSGGALVANTLFKGACTYTSGLAVKAALNGTTPNSSVFTALPAGITTLQIGSGRGNTIGNSIRAIQYWPRALSNAELQQVTR